MTPRLDFQNIAMAALPHMAVLCARWLPGGVRIGQEWCCGSLAGERGMSCKVNLRTGRWADFNSGEKGGDAISLAAAIHRISQAEAARRLADMLGISQEAAPRG